MKINEIETSTNPSISTNIGSKNHWGVKLTTVDFKLLTHIDVGGNLPDWVIAKVETARAGNDCKMDIFKKI